MQSGGCNQLAHLVGMGDGQGEILVKEGASVLGVGLRVLWVDVTHQNVEGRSLQAELIRVACVGSSAALLVVVLQQALMLSTPAPIHTRFEIQLCYQHKAAVLPSPCYFSTNHI